MPVARIVVTLRPMPGFNWHTVAGYGALLVECKGCLRRGVIRKDNAGLRMHRGNMDELNRATFRSRKCGGTAIRAYFPGKPDDAVMFMAGDPVGTLQQAI